MEFRLDQTDDGWLLGFGLSPGVLWVKSLSAGIEIADTWAALHGKDLEYVVRYHDGREVRFTSNSEDTSDVLIGQ
jgi:hypothetical protein